MSRYRLTALAKADLAEIERYIEVDGGAKLADRVIDEIVAEMRRLARQPNLGRPRRDVEDGRVRFRNANRFVIAYLPDVRPIEILRVIGGHRDFRKLFRRPK